MKASRKFSWRYVLLMSMVFAPWLMAAQCWSKIQNTTIPVEISRDFDFDVDIDQYAKGAPAKDGKIPEGAPDFEIPIDVKQDIDISDDPNIIKYGKKVAGIQINKMEIQVVSNSSNVNIDRVNIVMGDNKATPVKVVGYLTGIPAGQTPTENVVKNEADRQVISDYLTKFAFSFGAGTKLVAKAGTPVPKGKLKLRIKMTITFQIQILK